MFDTLEKAFNAWLRLDPDALAAIAALEGRVIGLTLLGTGLTLFIQPHAGGVHISGECEGEPDTVLSGTPLGLAAMGLGQHADQAFFSGQVSIRGDTELGQTFKQILDQADIDWEEPLSQLVGDPLAHQAGRLLRHIKDTLKRGGATLQQDLSEYLREEARLLPSRIELENFFDDIDRLREDSDRLAARIDRLTMTAAGGGVTT